MNDPGRISSEAVARTVAGGGTQRSRRWRLLLVLALLALGIAIGWQAWTRVGGAPVQRFLTESVQRTTLVVKVSATGNLAPTNQVEVGSELSGTVDAVLVEDNEQVSRDQVLARLNPARLSDQVERSSAGLAVARAQLSQAEAGLAQARGDLDRLRQAWRLSDGKVPSRGELAAAQATQAKAIAGLASAKASVAQALAALRTDQTNLRKATIRSPIDGVVLLRKVQPGQTVAASLQAPVLFVLAESLSSMELQVGVDEADVGQVRDGQHATFTVDAYPGRSFDARIKRIRFGSSTSNGVVTYPTVLEVDNRDLSLRPGMTATASIVTLERKDALCVPNAALRFAPPQPKVEQRSGGVASILLPRPSSDSGLRRATLTPLSGSEQSVWILDRGTPRELRVTIGASDGRLTEILSGELHDGDRVIVDMDDTPQ